MNKNWMALVFLMAGMHGSFALDSEFDYGPEASIRGKPATAKVYPVKLGDTKFEACLAVSHYTDEADNDPDFVTISVGKKRESGTLVLFQRQFTADAVSRDILKSRTEDVMSYDENLKTVSFDIDGKVFRYVLPKAE